MNGINNKEKKNDNQIDENTIQLSDINKDKPA